MIVRPSELPAGSTVHRQVLDSHGRFQVTLPNGIELRVESRHNTTVPRGYNDSFWEDPDDHNAYIERTDIATRRPGPEHLRIYPVNGMPGHGRWETHTREEFDHLVGLLAQEPPSPERRPSSRLN